MNTVIPLMTKYRVHVQMGNHNNNAFKFRKLFQMFDKGKTGQVHYEDFRNMCETFGMQLDDDLLLALCCVYDPEGTGFLSYHSLASKLMDPDCYALYINDVDLSQGKVDELLMTSQLKAVKTKYSHIVPDLSKILQGFDKEASGFCSKQEVLGACASLGLVLTSKEFSGLSAGCSDASGSVNYTEFCAAMNSI